MSEAKKDPFLKPGVILNDRWDIIEHIATGGKGEVYLARQTNLDREVVVKTISKEYLADLDDDEEYIETELQRFHREALAMAKVRHPYIVQVYDQDEAVVTVNGVEDSVQYLVMEYIAGSSLRSTMPTEGFCSSEQAAQEWIKKYFIPVLEGIQSIHDLGIVHRDVKPENVLLENATPKIMDFGIAGGARWSGLTKSHHVEGTITYMAPEQFMDLGETDVRGDVYALGKILYESVVGKLDKKTACPLKSVSLHCSDTAFWKRLNRIVEAATAEDPDQRIPSVKVLQERLEKLLSDFDASKLHFAGVSLPRPNRWQLALGLAVTALILGLIIASNLAHHFIMVEEEQQGVTSLPIPSKSEEKRKEDEIGTAPDEGTLLKPSLLGKDRSVLKYVPGGDFIFPGPNGSKPGKAVHVAPFFMGETEVTSMQYVDFLNRVRERITIDDGVVKDNGNRWLVLGEVFGGYEPIVFENGRFSLTSQKYGAYPVVQVTGYGASAYARFYDLRLPTEFQWYAAARVGKGSARNSMRKDLKSSPGAGDLEREMDGLVDLYGVLDKVQNDSRFPGSRPSLIPHGVSVFPRNELDIRGLRSNVGEWGWRTESENPGSEHTRGFVILGGLKGTWLLGGTLIRGPVHGPSEALVSVGFRVVKESDVQTPKEE